MIEKLLKELKPTLRKRFKVETINKGVPTQSLQIKRLTLEPAPTKNRSIMNLVASIVDKGDGFRQ